MRENHAPCSRIEKFHVLVAIGSLPVNCSSLVDNSSGYFGELLPFAKGSCGSSADCHQRLIPANHCRKMSGNIMHCPNISFYLLTSKVD